MKLNVIVSTFNEGIEKVSEVLLPLRPDVHYIISHQYTDERYLQNQQSLLKRSDVSVFPVFGKGLSKNRNNGLKYATGDIVLIADDDVRYFDDSFDVIINTYKSQPKLDMAFFKIQTAVGEPEYKAYASQVVKLSSDFIPHYVSSIEMTLRLSSINETSVKFDEHFGLGSGLFAFGEEAILLYDGLESGLNVKFFPNYIVQHPYESSAKSMNGFDHDVLVNHGAIYGRVFGYKAYWFILKKGMKKILTGGEKEVSSVKYFRLLLKGANIGRNIRKSNS